MIHEADDTPNDTWSVGYSDHSGNSYRFWKNDGAQEARFAYDPVTPERSSSGTYSGGDPQRGTLELAQVDALFQRIRDLEADTGNHARSRMMGTGSFRVSEGGGGERRFIIRSGPGRQAFDTFLEPFREGEQDAANH